jgi:hypothetical protein
MFYTVSMPKPSRPSSLTFKIPGWLEASATGWAVVLMPLLVAMLLGFAVFVWAAQ